MNKQFVPKWLLLILLILVLGNLTIYYLISGSPRIEDLFINLSATFLGILVTLFFIDKIIKYYQEKEWEEFEQIISKQIVDIIFSFCNYSNISSNLWERYLEIFKEDVDTKSKIVKYIKIYNASEINLDYIKIIVNDNHLIDFFSNGYNGILRRLDDVYMSYSHKLTADQSTQLIQLKSNLTMLINNMNQFYTTNFAMKEFHIPLETGHLNDYKENVTKTILTVDKLFKSI